MGAIAKINVDHLIGKEVGTATILKELARGGMAIVFIAYQRTLKRQIALKILPKKLMTPKTARRFQSEAESAAILSHPNIIPVYEVGETDDFLFFTMQLVQGNDAGLELHDLTQVEIEVPAHGVVSVEHDTRANPLCVTLRVGDDSGRVGHTDGIFPL